MTHDPSTLLCFVPFCTLAKFRFPHFRKLVGDDCFSFIVDTFYMQHPGSNLLSMSKKFKDSGVQEDIVKKIPMFSEVQAQLSRHRLHRCISNMRTVL